MDPFVIETSIGTIYVSASEEEEIHPRRDYWAFFHKVIAKLLIEEYRDKEQQIIDREETVE